MMLGKVCCIFLAFFFLSQSHNKDVITSALKGGQIFPPVAGEMVSDTCVLLIRRKHLPKLKYVPTGHECPSAIEDEESRFVFLQLCG